MRRGGGGGRGEGERESAYSIWGVRGLHTRSVEEESNGCGRLALPFTEGIHQLLQLGCALDLEKHLVVVVGDFDVEMLRLGWFLRLVHRWGSIAFRHSAVAVLIMR